MAVSNDLGQRRRGRRLAGSAAAANVFQLSPSADARSSSRPKMGRSFRRSASSCSSNGDAAAGELVFKNTKGANCVHCHQIGNDGNMIGPPLTVIGSKLNKGQLYEAILYPSASILMHYETWVVKTKKGDVISGLLVEDTPTTHPEGFRRQVSRFPRWTTSPRSDAEDLADARRAQRSDDQQDLVNLVEFLSTPISVQANRNEAEKVE